MQADALAIERARARVSAAIGSPLVPEDDRSFEVDLANATFTARREGRIAFSGTCQIVARQSNRDLWRWGFDEPEIPKIATSDLRALVRSDAVLFESSLASPLAVPDAAFALRLATWIALRAGLTGATAATIEGQVAYVALDVVARDGPGSDGWCFACGGGGELFSREGVSLCRACANDLRDLGEPHPFDPKRVVFEGTLRTPADIVTLRAAFGSAPNLALTAPGVAETPGDHASAPCLFCGLVRGDVLVLNDGFTVCPACAELCVSAFDPR